MNPPVRIRTNLFLVALSLALGLAVPALAQRVDDSARDRPGDFAINRPANLYSRPSVDATIVGRLNPRTIVRVVEVTDQWYKIRSTTGKEGGFIRRSYADPFDGRSARGGDVGSARGSGNGGGGGSGERMRFRIGIFKLIEPAIVHTEPTVSSPKVATLREGAEVRIVDKNGLWYKIESERGNKPPGWIPTTSAKRLGDVVADPDAPRAPRYDAPSSRRERSRDDSLDEEPAPSRRSTSDDDWGRF